MQWLAVAIGGGVGAVCRYALALAIPYVPGKLPMATLVANVLGSFLIGALFVLIVEKMLLTIVWRQVLMVGFLGALTTFSTFSMEVVQMLYTGHWRMACLYVVISLIASISAAFTAYMMFDRLL